MYTIIEDASPYYIRFTFSGLDEFIKHVNALNVYESANRMLDYGMEKNRPHTRMEFYTAADSIAFINKLPFADKFDWHYLRASPLHMFPNTRSPIHKDGSNNRVSFNISLEILDQDCVTSWYTDEEMNDCAMVDHIDMRFLADPYTRRRQPIKSFTQQPGEIVLFNTDIFHQVDNMLSKNTRRILTLRINPKVRGNVYFDDAKRLIFQ
jgi:hypothetical protein